LGEILVNDGLASKEQVFDALTAQQHQPEPKTPLGEILLQAKAITERALDQALHKQEKTAEAGGRRRHDPSGNQASRQRDELWSESWSWDAIVSSRSERNWSSIMNPIRRCVC
jgi:hypothetical protein